LPVGSNSVEGFDVPSPAQKEDTVLLLWVKIAKKGKKEDYAIKETPCGINEKEGRGSQCG